MKARAALISVPALLALVLVGCGGTEAVSVGSDPDCPSSMTQAEYQACIGEEGAGGEDAAATEDPEASEEESAEAAAGPLSHVGTVTYSDNAGTTFSENFKVGPLHKGSELTPPQGVLGACDDDYSTGIASSVFAHGEASITYEKDRFLMNSTSLPAASGA